MTYPAQGAGQGPDGAQFPAPPFHGGSPVPVPPGAPVGGIRPAAVGVVAAIFGVIALGALVVLGVILAVDSRHLDDPMLLGLSLVSAVMALVLLVGSAVAGILVVSGSEVGRGFAFGVSGYAAVDYLSRALSDSIVSWTSGWPIAQVVTALLSFAISGAAITAFALLLSRPVTNWFHEVRAAKTGSSAPAAPAYQ